MDQELFVEQNNAAQVYQMLPANTTQHNHPDVVVWRFREHTGCLQVRYQAVVQEPLAQVTLLDLQHFSDSLVCDNGHSRNQRRDITLIA